MKKALLATLLVALSGMLPAQQPELAVTGRVVDEHGRPLQGAVLLPVARGEFVDVTALLRDATTSTDDRGRYRAVAEPRHANGWLLVAKEGRQAVAHYLDWRDLDSGQPIGDLVLVPGNRLTGRVRDTDGAPIAGAHVTVSSAVRDIFGYTDTARSGATSDDKGIFVVPCVPPTGLWLQVAADGFLPRSTLVSMQSPTDVTMQPADTVTGRVVDEHGAPLAGFHVHVVDALDLDLGADTGDDGAFTVFAPKQLPYRVRAFRSDRDGSMAADSGVLGGPRTDLALTARRDANGRTAVHVVARDQGSGAVLERIHVRSTSIPVADAQLALLHAFDLADPVRPGECDVTVPAVHPTLVIDAEGHGFALASVPSDGSPVEVTLGPECFVTGVVTDEVTGAPLADVAVRVLPWGNNSGTGQRDFGPPRTDAHGRFRVGGLPPGDYAVQAHARQRLASPPVRFTAASGEVPDVALQVPAPLLLKVAVEGDPPRDAPTPRLRVGGAYALDRGPGYFAHALPTAPPVYVDAEGDFPCGPVASLEAELFAFVPSRRRAATGAARRLHGDGRGDFAVPAADLQPVLVTGRVAVDAAVPCERIGVIAMPLTDREPGAAPERQRECATRAAADADGNFTLELLPQPHELDLVDLATGIVFHREPEPFTPDGDAPLRLEPVVRLVEVRCVPEEEGGPLLGLPLRVQMRAADGSARTSELHPTPAVRFAPGETTQTWLLGDGELRVVVEATFDELLPDGATPRPGPAGASFAIDAATKTLDVPVPAPPPLPGARPAGQGR